MELYAALLLTKLYILVTDALKIEFDLIRLWSDSMKNDNPWFAALDKRFATLAKGLRNKANRIAEIQRCTHLED